MRFARLPLHLQYWSQMVPAMVLVAFGFGLVYVAVTVAAVSDATEADAGLASGMVTTAQQVGGALGLAVLVSIATARASSMLGGAPPGDGAAGWKSSGLRGRGRPPGPGRGACRRPDGALQAHRHAHSDADQRGQ